jgi:two-component system sensor histidine kinase RpfC
LVTEKTPVAEESERVVRPLSLPAAGEMSREHVLDESKLDNLWQIGSSSDFVPSLVSGFNQDGQQLMQSLRRSVVDKDYPLLRDAAHALKGTSAELGGVKLVGLCKAVESVKPYDMASSKLGDLVKQIDQTYQDTCLALTEYLQRKCNMVH